MKRLTNNGRQGSWGTFKHRLMDHLGIPQEQFNDWSVPQDWQDAYKRAAGRGKLRESNDCHEPDGTVLERGVAADITRRVLRAYLDQIERAR